MNHTSINTAKENKGKDCGCKMIFKNANLPDKLSNKTWAVVL
jgi:hypothetical protein